MRKKIASLLLLLTLAGCFAFQTKHTDEYQITENSLPVSLLWEFKANGNLLLPATIHAGKAVYFRTSNQVYAVDPRNGVRLWQRQLATSASILPIPHGNLVVFVKVHEEEIEALDSATGETVWEFDPSYHTTSRASAKALVRFVATDGKALYVVVNLFDGTDILMPDPDTGALIGRAPAALADERFPPRYFFVGESWVVVETNERWILTKNLERVLFQWPDVTFSKQTPTMANNVLYTSGGSVKAIEVPFYDVRWTFDEQCPWSWDQIPDSPSVVGGNVYPFTTCSILYKLDAQTGRTLWEFHAAANDVRSFKPLNDYGFLVATDTTIQAIDLESGQEVGRLQMTPNVAAKLAWDYLAVEEELLVLTYGNSQAFAFQAR